MNPRSLEEDLLSIAGVEGAEVEGTSDKPAGLRIRIAEGADQATVGTAIRRVLNNHGLGTDTRLPGEASEASDGPHLVSAEDLVDNEPDFPDAELESDPTPAAVALLDEESSEIIDLTDSADVASDEEPQSDPVDDVPDVAVEGAPAEGSGSHDETAALTAVPDTSTLEVEEPAMTPVEPAPAEPASGGVERISAVSVEEGRDGIRVTVTSTDGTAVSQVAASSEGGVESAVIRATARLARPESPEAIVVDVDDRRVEGVDIVMIVLDLDGEMLAGSAVVGAGRSFALGRATWAALSL